jgi:hypothetical protein
MRKWFAVLGALALGAWVAVACSSSSTGSSGGADAGSGNGGTEAGGGDGDGLHDAQLSFDSSAGEFGASCEGGSDCDSGVCFVGAKISFCSMYCDSGAQCPNPPTSGTCNMLGYCK